MPIATAKTVLNQTNKNNKRNIAPISSQATLSSQATMPSQAKAPNLSAKRKISSKKRQEKGYVIQISPGQAHPLPKFALSEQNQFMDFKMVKATWLSKYLVLHKKVTQIIESEKKEVLGEAKLLFQEFPKSALLPYRLYVEELKLFSPVNADIVSVRMRLYTYTGGAHGGSQYYSLNYSLKEKKFLSLQDIFPISNYCAKLIMVGLKSLFQKQPLDRCQKPTPSQKEIVGSEEFLNLIISLRELLWTFRKQGNKYDKYVKQDILRGTSEKKHFKIWNLQKGKIVFLFPEYQIGPYSAGSFEVFIPL